MPAKERTILRIEQPPSTTVLSPAQKQFNKLSKNIESKKRLLRQWQDTLPEYDEKVRTVYQDAQSDFYTLQIEQVRLFDKACEDPQFTAREKAKLKHLIGGMTEELLEHKDDQELKDLLLKYTGIDFDQVRQVEEAQKGNAIKGFIEGMFDIEFGEEADFSTPEKAESALKEQLEILRDRELEDQRQAEERQKRRKTPKQKEKEAREQEEAEKAGKSIQEVFRKLAAALHPDRERDASERERKTEIMQRVNAAYSKRDLLQLLELQLEVEQIDQLHLNNIAEDRLRYFNKVLKEQLAELQQEIDAIEMRFKMQLAMAPFERLTPKQLMSCLEEDTNHIRINIAALKRDLKAFQEKVKLKSWLKRYRIPRASDDEDLDDFLTGLFPASPFR